jgi:hypothetical protein
MKATRTLSTAESNLREVEQEWEAHFDLEHRKPEPPPMNVVHARKTPSRHTHPGGLFAGTPLASPDSTP